VARLALQLTERKVDLHDQGFLMKRSLIGFNAVVVARVFNPSIIRESWLLREGLLLEGELQPGYVFTEQVAQIPTPRFNIVVVPQQLQFAPSGRETAKDVVDGVLSKIIEKLQHTQYTAVGINFVWRLDAEPEETIMAASRRLFLSGASPLAAEFSAEDANFGFYASKDVGKECRLKLDIKPMHTIHPTGGREHFLNAAFNFHCDVAEENAASQIIEALSRWSEFEELSARMVDTLVGALKQ
jgi:hypothetical protein